MISVSNSWKQAMSQRLRERIYISVGIGVINQNAQGSGTVNTELAYWSKGNVFDNTNNYISYATMEENYFKADGSMYFMPENSETMQLLPNGLVTNDILQPIRIDFPQIYAIKGITLEFGNAYPTEFTIETSEKTLNYTNDSTKFVTDDVLGDTDYILITPISMVGGKQRFRLYNVLMGVGLAYTNKDTKDMSLSEFVSSISDELPNENMSYTFFDTDDNFNVDDDNSFIDFLEAMQKITLSFGVTLEDKKTVEWKQVATMFLKDWKSQKGIVSINATDRLSQMEDTYTLGNKIYTRTAYDEAESIFTDAGLEPDEYFIDDYLKDITFTNPMPELMHKECLQLLANACRCIIKQDENGRIIIRANFANVLDPDDLTVSTNGVAEWSKPENILVGTEVVYAELTQDFFKADGSMYFLPEDDSYLENSYISEQISDENGDFDKNIIDTNILQGVIRGTGTYKYNSITINKNAKGTTYFYKDYSNLEIGKTYTASTSFVTDGLGGFFRVMYVFKDATGTLSYENITTLWKDESSGNLSITFTPTKEFESIRLQFALRNDNADIGTTITFSEMQLEVGEITTSYLPSQENPKIFIDMPLTSYYYGVNVSFEGNFPKEMIIHTYKSNVLKESIMFTELKKNNYLIHEFLGFDKIVFEITKGYPNNRVLINKISFGDLSDYVLTRADMMSEPIGYKEKRVKLVRCKIFTYKNDTDGNYILVEDSVFVEKSINPVGETKTIQNPLISTQEQAELLVEWIGNYYANNISYDVDYRGRPDINATDIIHMDSEKLNNLQVEITSNNLEFNSGTLSGSLELRRALKMMGE